MKHPPTEESIPIPQTAAKTLASPPDAAGRGGVHPRTRSRPPPPGGSAPWAPRRFRQPRRGPGPRWACRCPTSTTTPASGRSSSRCPSFPLLPPLPRPSQSLIIGGGWRVVPQLPSRSSSRGSTEGGGSRPLGSSPLPPTGPPAVSHHGATAGKGRPLTAISFRCLFLPTTASVLFGTEAPSPGILSPTPRQRNEDQRTATGCLGGGGEDARSEARGRGPHEGWWGGPEPPSPTLPTPCAPDLCGPQPRADRAADAGQLRPREGLPVSARCPPHPPSGARVGENSERGAVRLVIFTSYVFGVLLRREHIRRGNPARAPGVDSFDAACRCGGDGAPHAHSFPPPTQSSTE